ncbi:MAG: hypothetical protein ABSE90_02965 [Verrucomicrobiota bacterium]
MLAIALLSQEAVAHAGSTPSVLQLRLVSGKPMADSEQMTVVQPNNSPRQPEVLNVQKAVLLDRSDVKSAMVVVNDGTYGEGRGDVMISIKLTDAGTKRFAEVTRKNIGRRLAIVIDGRLYMAPRINSEIPGGEMAITGAFTKEEAENLAAKMNNSPAGKVSFNATIVFYGVGLLFLAAVGIAALILMRRKNASPAA